ncbi:choline/glycine/proline betaine transport protein [Pseudoalteromonas citrea]|uniref:Choline/glycine/proline betaine transport protein n=2 Tax=Pseudoalteromonas citrea TaxID=43655 RepID=A0AAD4AK56_9GAMM|nr:choline BCCT transporter BetT [Pseudoalteromonas citrea]KAF7773833.1 choline/glycine/proline betaine transport protein [Pseudoalteromonas citrea]
MSEHDVKAKLNPPVFYCASGLIILLVIFTAFMPETADTFFQSLQASIVHTASWFYVLTVAIILITVAYLGLSRFGNIKLGPDHSTPDYSHTTWFAMLFSAGMGIGLMFFGVAEPVMHFLSPPVAESGSVEAAREAMKITFFHWGLHAWAIYAIVALILAFFSYRHGLPLTLRSALYPLIGDKIYGPIGHAVDIFAVIGTVFGVATSLGYGVLQVNSGLNYLFDVPVGLTTQVVLIAVVTGLAILSVTTGLDKGIRRLSELNMGLAVLMLLFVLILGPTIYLLQAFVQNVGAYTADIVRNTFNLFAYEKTEWLGGWTILYWGWWMSWAPFVGLFIARVSRGRTIREFAMGVLFIPTGFTLMWMTFFGNSAIDLIMNQGIASLGEAVSKDVAVSIFVFLEQFPLSGVLSFVATLMVIIFFVTSSDSGSMVVDMLCSNGNNNTPLWQRIYWAGGEGVVAAVLLIAGGLGALQTMTIASALPFAVILLIATWGLIKALRVDAAKRESLQMNVAPVAPANGNTASSWQERLGNIVDFPNKPNVNKFINNAALAAINSVASELNQHNIETQVDQDEKLGRISLLVLLGEELDFKYEVRRRSSDKPSYVEEDDDDSEDKYYRAEVHLREGGQDYDVMGWSKEAVINDIVDQYHKHMHFLHTVR